MTCSPVSTRNDFNGDGSTTQFQYTFDVPNSASSVVVQTLAEDGEAFVDAVEGDDYTIDLNAKIVTFLTAPAEGVKVRIHRCTNRERSVEWENASRWAPATANFDEQQSFAVKQEIEQDLSDALKLNDRGDRWNARGIILGYGLPAVRGDDLPTLDQVEALIQDGDVIRVDQTAFFQFEGDGVETDFTLSGYRQTESTMWLVFKNGVHQNGNTDSGADPDYSVVNAAGQDDVLSFDEPPEDGTKIIVFGFVGTVISRIRDDSIETDHIQDGAVTLAKLGFSAGAARRFIVVAASGEKVLRQAVSTDIQDFTAAVRANTLNQMAAPTTNLNVNGKKIVNAAAGSAATDVVVVSQLPTSPARVGSGDIDVSASPFGSHAVDTGFKCHQVTVSFAYINVGGTILHGTATVVLTDTHFDRTVSLAVEEDDTDPERCRVRIRRSSATATGFVLQIDNFTTMDIDGALAAPQAVSWCALGSA